MIDIEINMRVLASLGIILLFAIAANVEARLRKKKPGDLSIWPPQICGHVCAIHCPYGNVLDLKGCPTCKCKPQPPLLQLPPKCGPICKMRCPNGFVKDFRGCPICKCKTVKPPVKPPTKCGPTCIKFCPNGFLKDKNGCSICICKPFKPKPPVKPPKGCGPVCLRFCPFGNVLDERGCPTCNCKVLKPPIKPPVLPPGKCGPLCRRFCPYGFVKGKDGCPICKCKPRPSRILRCPRGSFRVTPTKTCKNPRVPVLDKEECGRRGFCYTKGKESGICCRRYIRRPIPTGMCPRIKPKLLCKQRLDQCKTDKDCKIGRCCPGMCGRECKRVFPLLPRPRPKLPKLPKKD